MANVNEAREVHEAEVLSATGQVLVKVPGKKAKKRVATKRPGRGSQEERLDAIESVERELYERNLGVVLDASYFGDVDPADMTTVPQPWISALGVEEATRRFRVAKAAMLSGKEAPTGLGVAKYIVGAFAKAKAQGNRPTVLNVNLISMVSGPKELPAIEICEESK